MPPTKRNRTKLPEFRCLRRRWERLKEPGGMGSLLEFAKNQKSSFDLTELDKELSKIEFYSRYRKQRRKYKRPSYIIHHTFSVYCMDLIDMSNLAWYNSNRKWILVVLDQFSKRLALVSQKSKSRSDTAEALEKALKNLSKGGKRFPEKICSDDGLEFKNAKVQALLNRYGIYHYAIRSKNKSSLCENVIKHTKIVLYKYMDINNTKRYLDILQDVADKHNATIHNSHKFAPNQVTDSNAEEAFSRMNGHLQGKPRLPPKYEVGNYVRVAGRRLTFQKGYRNLYSSKIFRVKKVVFRPPVYTFVLEGADKKVLPTTFVAEELSLASSENQEDTQDGSTN